MKATKANRIYQIVVKEPAYLLASYLITSDDNSITTTRYKTKAAKFNTIEEAVEAYYKHVDAATRFGYTLVII